MKKAIPYLIVALIALAVTPAFAFMDTKDYPLAVTGTGTTSNSFVIRGEIEAVSIVTVPTGATGDVTITSGEDTIFAKTGIAAAATYHPVTPIHTYAGVAATVASYSATYTVTATTNEVITWYGDGSSTNETGAVIQNLAQTNTVITHRLAPASATTSNPLYGKFAVAGSVRVNIDGKSATNGTWRVRIIYNR